MVLFAYRSYRGINVKLMPFITTLKFLEVRLSTLLHQNSAICESKILNLVCSIWCIVLNVWSKKHVRQC